MKNTFVLLLFFVTSGQAQTILTKANNDFALKFYKASRPESDNYFISPLSLNIALSAINEGARGKTKQELDHLLSLPFIERKDTLFLDLIYKSTNLKDSSCFDGFESRNSNNSFIIANSAWINKELQIESKYREIIQNYYRTTLFEFDRKELDESNQRLDRWIAKETHGIIKDAPDLTSLTELSFINATYFFGEWDYSFSKRKTKVRNFHTGDKRSVKLDFMNSTSYYDYFEDDEIQGIFLPYDCNQFSMLVLLPKERYGLANIEDKFNVNYLDTIKKTGFSKVILSLPKFKLETEMSPIGIIMDMGYKEAFSDHADFSSLSIDKNLKIGQIVHKTFIEVDEEKTEAAALTQVGMVIVGASGDAPPPPPPKVFNANHPFLFLILDNRTNAIVFMGRFVK